VDWASTAILSAALLGVVNIFDSHLITKRMPGFRAFLLLVTITHVIYAVLAFFYFPLPEGIGIWPVLVAVVAGLLRTASIIIMLYIMTKEEVSRVVPVVYTYPIFVAIIAVPVLGEPLSYLQWLAIVIVVSGAAMVSIRKDLSSTTAWLGKPFLLLFGASLLMAMSDLTSKYALSYMSFWNMFCINAFLMSASFLLISVRPSVLRQIVNMKRKKSSFALIALNETIAPTAILLSIWALQRGPVSLVSTISSTRPIFVVIYALILSRVLPAFLEWRTGGVMLALRLIGTAMTVGGIAIIYLT